MKKPTYFFSFILLIFLLSPIPAKSQESQQEQTESLYSKYEATPKTLNMMEYNLIKVNLRLAKYGYFLDYDHNKKTFTSVKFVENQDILKQSSESLRNMILSECELVSAVTGYIFPEFRNRKTKDLKIVFRIAEAGYGEFGVYENGELTFKAALYDFLKKHPKTF